jgi:hypothetical protein
MFVSRMKTFIESLSLGYGAILVALLSAGAVWLLCSVLPKVPEALWIVIVPFFFAYSLYWLPVWLGSDPSGYGVWAVLGVGTWFFSGFFPSAVLVIVLRKRRAK